MNDYGFDYFNYLTKIPENINNNKINYYEEALMNPMNFPQNNQSNMKIINNEQLLYDTKEGLSKGNMFKNLYNPYKDYIQKELNATNEQEAMLCQLMQYKFALKDLNLYLDVYPNDYNMLNLYQKYLMIEKQICDKYESMYGPLTTSSNSILNNKWEWNNNPWPWEVK